MRRERIAARGARPGAARRRGGPERGFSTTAVLAIAAVAAFLGLFAIKAGPVYFEHLTVEKIVADTAADADLMRSSRSRVYKQLNAQYRMNNLWDMKAEDTVELERDGERGYVARVSYERRESLFANIDLVMSFDGSPDDPE